MKYKQLKITLSFLLAIGLTGLQAQTLHVKQSEGTKTAYSLGDIRKINFVQKAGMCPPGKSGQR
jgi:hypothetical protein